MTPTPEQRQEDEQLSIEAAIFTNEIAHVLDVIDAWNELHPAEPLALVRHEALDNTGDDITTWRGPNLRRPRLHGGRRAHRDRSAVTAATASPILEDHDID